MSDQITVRPFEKEELPLIFSMLKESAENLQSKNISQWEVWLSPEAHPERLNWVTAGFEAGEFFAAELDGKLAGMYRLSYQDLLYWGEQEKPAGYIHSLSVRPAFAGRKLGELMLQYVETILKQQEILLLRLDCVAANARLSHYYESLGFMKVGEKMRPAGLNHLYEKPLA